MTENNGNGEKPRYVVLPWALAKEQLHRFSGSAVKVYICLLTYYSYKTESCYPAISAIAEQCGLSENGTRKALQELAGAGWVKFEKTAGGKAPKGSATTYQHNAYQLPLQGMPTAKGANSEPLRVQKVTPSTASKGAKSAGELYNPIGELLPEELVTPPTPRQRGEKAGGWVSLPEEIQHEILRYYEGMDTTDKEKRLWGKLWPQHFERIFEALEYQLWNGTEIEHSLAGYCRKWLENPENAASTSTDKPTSGKGTPERWAQLVAEQPDVYAVSIKKPGEVRRAPGRGTAR